MPSAPWRVEISKSFKKVWKRSKFQKCPKSFPNISNRNLGQIFGKSLGPVFHGGSILRKLSNFQPKTRKIDPKKIQNCFEHVLGQIIREISAQFSMEVRVFQKYQKKPRIFKVPKMPKIGTKSVQTCFEHVSGQIFPKKFFAQCSMEARDFGNFQKNQKFFKITKIAKIVPKRIQTCFERACFAANFSNKNFCPVFHGGSRVRKFSKKSKNFQNSKKAQNLSQTYPNVFWTCFGATFWKKFRRSLPWRIETSKIFEKKNKNFQSSRKAENRYQKCPNVFWTCFGANFSKKFFCPVFHGG